MPLKLCMILGKEGKRLSRACNECPGIGDAPLWTVAWRVTTVLKYKSRDLKDKETANYGQKSELKAFSLTQFTFYLCCIFFLKSLTRRISNLHLNHLTPSTAEESTGYHYRGFSELAP